MGSLGKYVIVFTSEEKISSIHTPMKMYSQIINLYKVAFILVSIINLFYISLAVSLDSIAKYFFWIFAVSWNDFFFKPLHFKFMRSFTKVPEGFGNFQICVFVSMF